MAEQSIDSALGAAESTAATSSTFSYSPPPSGFEYFHMVAIDSDSDETLVFQTVQVPSGESLPSRSFSVSHLDYLADSDGDGVGDVNEKSEGTDPDSASSTPTASTLDILALYGPAVTTLYDGDPGTRIDHIIAYSNQVLSDSNVDMQLRLVGSAEIAMDESQTIDEWINEADAKTGVYSDLVARQDAVGADLTLLFQKFNDGDTCGIANLGGFQENGDFTAQSNIDLGHTAIYIDFEACEDNTTLHELGHLMGLGHSFKQDETGAFDWSRGHGVVGSFATLMGYGSVFDAAELPFLSNPDISSCAGSPCGIDVNQAQAANSARSLNIVRFQIAKFRATVPAEADSDRDGDGVANADDAFPDDATETIDTDGDGIGNNADLDDDNDGYTDELEISLGLDPLDASDVTGSPREIFWRHSINGQDVLWSMESQHRVERNAINSVSDADWRVEGMADFTFDGTDDIFFRHQGHGQNRLWTISDGARSSSVAVRSAATDWSIISLGDFDADGDADLMWRNSSNGTNRYWEMQGSTRVSSLAVRTVSLDWSVSGSGDFDNDGRYDLLWRNSNGANVVWLMDAETRTDRGSLPTVAAPWEVAGVGDFDGDGMDDMFWHNPSTGANSIWLLSGTQRKARGSIPSTASDWSPFGVFDMNGDGFADILWRNNTSGANRLWLMNGTSRTSSLAIIPVSDQNWVPVAVGNVSN